MAFQPKSYRKFMVASASAALVGSAVAPAVSAATAADDFTDVSEDTRHYTHINALYDMGVVSGYGDGTFGPDNNLKRSEAAEMIFTARGLDVNTEYELTFEDVPSRIDTKVAALVQAEIFDGYSEVKFGSDMELNRAEMAKIVIEAFNLMPEGDVENADFGDLMDTKLYPYINAAAKLGIADGYENGNFGVHDPIKRKDFAKMLHNAWKLWEDNQGQTVASVNGSVKDVLGINWVVDIPVANFNATSESTVQLKVGEEMIDLSYNADSESFRNAEISTKFSKEDLMTAKLVVDGGTSGDTGETTDLGKVKNIENAKVKDVLGINRVVDLPLASLEGATAESSVWLDVEGEMVELPYDSENDSFRNAELSYSVEVLNEASVLVK